MGNNNVSIKLILLIAGFMICISSYGQKDKVYLINGSLIKGNVAEIGNEQIKVVSGKSELNLVIEDIRFVKLSKVNNIDKSQVEQLKKKIKSDFDKGFAFMLNVGLQVGATSDYESNKATWTSEGIVFYKFDPKLQFGISLGYDQHDRFNAVPFSVYYRGDLAKSPGGLFAYGSVGTSKMWVNTKSDIDYNDVEGGGVIQFGMGHSWELKKSELIATFGWKRQKVKSVNGQIWDWGGTEYVVSRSINRIEINFGIIF